MNTKIAKQDRYLAKSLNKLIKGAGSEDIAIDIFCESMTDYLKKLNAVATGCYELDNYDLQVIGIAIEQFGHQA